MVRADGGAKIVDGKCFWAGRLANGQVYLSLILDKREKVYREKKIK